MERDLPNLVRMDCSLLSGLVAEKLTSKTVGDLSRVFFCNSGTETIEGAIKFARCTTERQQIVYCDHAFHGLTLGSLSINGADFFRERFGQLLPETQKVPFNDLAKLEEVLSRKTAAAFILEPVQGKSCEVLADGYLTEARRLCTKYGTLLILDEVQAGLGRTGKWFCYQHWPHIEPDIVFTPKALSRRPLPLAPILPPPTHLVRVFHPLDLALG